MRHITMECNIEKIEKMFNNVNCKFEYEITITTSTEPSFQLGKCEVKQNERIKFWVVWYCNTTTREYRTS